MKTLLICHEAAVLDRDGLSRWTASFSQLCGLVVIRENPGRIVGRARREIRRVGPFRFLDVLAFRAYYRLFLAQRDRRWQEETLCQIRQRYPESPQVPLLVTSSPNSIEAEEFIRTARADIVLARCKTLLKERIFSLPSVGTFVLHPGICPEYRNAHGCFWALARRDLGRVGLTLLRIDRGIDTGPVYGYYRCDYDERRESHVVIQERLLFANLDDIRDHLVEIHRGRMTPLDTNGRPSAVWGQPRLTSYLQWKYRVRAHLR